MSQSIQAEQEHPFYSYDDASNASSYAGAEDRSLISSEFSILNSRAFWALGLLAAFVVIRIVTQREKLPAGVKRLPKLPGMYAMSSSNASFNANADDIQVFHISVDHSVYQSQARKPHGTLVRSTKPMARSMNGKCLVRHTSGSNPTRLHETC